jgi:fucose permease
MSPARIPAGSREQVATRLIFFIIGFAMAAWAPLVPLAKTRLGLEDGVLGLLLLCLGLGSILAMPIAGILTTRIGCRRVIVASALGILIILPFLAVIDSTPLMAVALVLFGATIGSVDVTMNLQAILVERDSGKAMMSGFHGLFSVGGIAGAGGVSALIATGMVSPLAAAIAVSVVSLALLMVAMPGLLNYGDDGDEKPPLFVVPKGIVLFIGLLCFLCFMVEGSILDWSAAFLISERGADLGLAGLGYAMFAIAMTVGRLTGDRLRSWC